MSSRPLDTTDGDDRVACMEDRVVGRVNDRTPNVLNGQLAQFTQVEIGVPQADKGVFDHIAMPARTALM